MAIKHHPTVKRIIFILLFVFIPALIATCYFWLAEGNHAEELFISVLVFLCAGGLCLFSYFTDAEEIAFCEEHGVSEEALKEVVSETASSATCGGNGEGGSDV